jgi:pimeloyl-ACP methyl ester carboxylesterase
MAQRTLLEKYGGSFRTISYQDLGRYWNTSPYYSEVDKSNLMRAFVETQRTMWARLMAVDLMADIRELQVSVYFFTGRYDYQTPFELLEDYFEMLEAPYKEIVWFENSGHVPNLDEPEVYQDMLINIVLKNTLGE